MRRSQLEREKQDQERVAMQEKRRELLGRFRCEKRRVHDLETEAENWHRAGRIRANIEAVKKIDIVSGRHMEEGSRAQWIKWAQEQADRRDPLVDSPPSILDEEKTLSSFWPE
jgi:hypothetical protein